MSFIEISKPIANIQGVVGIVSEAFAQFDALFAMDVVAILDHNFNQLFDLARPMKANINPQSRLMDHPIEDGSLISDFRIILPVEIELGLIIGGDEYRAVYQTIKQTFLAGDQLTVQTRGDTYFNICIEGMPREETPEQFDVLVISLRMREVQIVEVQYQALPPAAVAAPEDQSTVVRGAQQPQPSLLFQGLTATKKFFGN